MSDEIEVFEMLGSRWNITEAKKLVAATLRTFDREGPDGKIRIADVAAAVAGNDDEGGVLGGVRIDKEHAATVDLADPIIVATMPMEHEGKPVLYPIDGWHRIYRAHREGIDRLPAYVLTRAESKRVMIAGPSYRRRKVKANG